MDHVIRPLRQKNIVQYKFISWKVDKIKKEEDDDDIVFGTNPFFKLLALILSDMNDDKMTWRDICSKFDSFKWRNIVDEKHAQIEDAEDLWNEIKEEIGASKAEIVIPILNRASDPAGMDAKLQEALNKAA